MAPIFISYSRADEAFAQRLVASLQQAGAEVWIDVAGVRSGDDWSDSIQAALDTCDVMLLLISPDSMASENVADEWKYQLDEGKTLLPVLLRPAKVHFQLRRLQYIDFFKQDYATAFAQLHAELLRKGVALHPLAISAGSVAIPLQEPLPTSNESLDEFVTRAGMTSGVAVGQGGYAVPAYAPPIAAPQPTPLPSRVLTPPPAPGAAAPGMPASNLLDYTVNAMRERHWRLTGYSAEGAWLEGWTYGAPGRKKQINYLMLGLGIVLGIFGGVIAGFIASRSYKSHRVSLTQQPDGTLLVQGSLGTYQIARPEDAISLAHYVEVDKNPINGLAPWVYAIAIGLISTILCYSCYASYLAGSNSAPGYY